MLCALGRRRTKLHFMATSENPGLLPNRELEKKVASNYRPMQGSSRGLTDEVPGCQQVMLRFTQDPGLGEAVWRWRGPLLSAHLLRIATKSGYQHRKLSPCITPICARGTTEQGVRPATPARRELTTRSRTVHAKCKHNQFPRHRTWYLGKISHGYVFIFQIGEA